MTDNDRHITRLLEAASAGDRLATDKVFPLVYDELHRIAQAMMSRERGPGPYTLQPTALVHEAYFRLIGPGDVSWQNKAHFFGAAATAMRRILIDRARRVKSASRGTRVAIDTDSALPTLDSGNGAPANADKAADDLIALDQAMESLRSRDARQHEVVMLRFFAGLTIEQVALTMDLSQGTIKADWAYARAWLLREMERFRAVD